MLGPLQHNPGAFDVSNQHALRRGIHALTIGFELGLDVEEVRFDVAALAVSVNRKVGWFCIVLNHFMHQVLVF